MLSTANTDSIIRLSMVLAVGVVVSLLEWLVYRRLMPVFTRKQQVWRQSFLTALHQPLQIYVWILVASFMASTISRQLDFNGDFIESIQSARHIITLVFIFWFAMRFIRKLEHGMVIKACHDGKGDQTSIRAISQLIRVVVIIIVLMMLMQTIGIKMSALLAFGGVGAAAVGFAAKDTISNFIGGMMIYWDRPFSVGDWIASPDKNIEGTVENIGWRLTRIRSFDKRPIYVPNGILSNIVLVNPSRMLNRRIKTSIGVRYKDASKITVIAQSIEKMLREHPEIDTQQTIFVNLYQFAASSLNVLVYSFTKTTEWIKFQAIQQDVFLKIIDIIEQHGASCAFPTQTLDVPDALVLQQLDNTQGESNHGSRYREDHD